MPMRLPDFSVSFSLPCLSLSRVLWHEVSSLFKATRAPSNRAISFLPGLVTAHSDRDTDDPGVATEERGDSEDSWYFGLKKGIEKEF